MVFLGNLSIKSQDKTRQDRETEAEAEAEAETETEWIAIYLPTVPTVPTVSIVLTAAATGRAWVAFCLYIYIHMFIYSLIKAASGAGQLGVYVHIYNICTIPNSRYSI